MYNIFAHYSDAPPEHCEVMANADVDKALKDTYGNLPKLRYDFFLPAHINHSYFEVAIVFLLHTAQESVLV
jgi:hypothetical protein